MKGRKGGKDEKGQDGKNLSKRLNFIDFACKQ